MFSFKRWVKRSVVLSLLIISPLFQANATITLPDPDCGFAGGDNCLIYDDFTVFSMAFLQYNLDGSLKPVANDTYYIDSSPGKIQDDIVIASSPASAIDNTDIGTDLDDAFESPTATGNNVSLFAMMADHEPTPDGWTGDNVQQSGTLLSNPDNLDIDNDGAGDGNLDGKLSLWDIQTNELTDFLDGDDLLFFFNLNEKGSQEALDAGQDMLGWMRVYLTNSTTGASVSFTLSGNNTAAPLIQAHSQVAGVNNILPTDDDLWAYVRGEICVDSTNGAVLALSSCSAAGNPANGVSVNQNLGANAAAFGLWNSDLNDALYSGLYDVMSVDMRMAHIDNGYDQLFIRGGNVGTQISEPSMLALLALGIIGLAWRQRALHHK